MIRANISLSSGLPAAPPCAMAVMLPWWRKVGQGEWKAAQREAGSAGTPENTGITNTRACCFIFSGMRGPEGNKGMWESYFFSVLLMEPLAVFMPDLFSSEVCHAWSPTRYFSFDMAWRNTSRGLNCWACRLPSYQFQLL